MAIQLSTPVRNAELDAVETAIGASPLLRIYSGAQPANCAAAASGTLLAEFPLPADFFAAAANGVKSLSGTWQEDAAVAAGTAGHFRIYDNGDTACHMQGSAGETADAPNLVLQNKVIAVGQVITITQFNMTAGNA
ncbi:MAG TPA: hypothetical protein PKD55_02435 [Bellilinea sp.]|nr:hypothetical protein [Bellilinea sp.]